jgi:hypothetical protein
MDNNTIPFRPPPSVPMPPPSPLWPMGARISSWFCETNDAGNVVHFLMFFSYMCLIFDYFFWEKGILMGPISSLLGSWRYCFTPYTCTLLEEWLLFLATGVNWNSFTAIFEIPGVPWRALDDSWMTFGPPGDLLQVKRQFWMMRGSRSLAPAIVSQLIADCVRDHCLLLWNCLRLPCWEPVHLQSLLSLLQTSRFILLPSFAWCPYQISRETHVAHHAGKHCIGKNIQSFSSQRHSLFLQSYSSKV